MKRISLYLILGFVIFILGWISNEAWRFAKGMKQDNAKIDIQKLKADSIAEFLNPNDSTTISKYIIKYHAIKLTDSIRSPIPSNIRILTINYLRKNQLNPNEFFTIPHSFPSYNDDKSECYLNVLRIGALIDLSVGQDHLGASGGENDDLVLIFSRDYRKVIRMITSE